MWVIYYGNIIEIDFKLFYVFSMYLAHIITLGGRRHQRVCSDLTRSFVRCNRHTTSIGPQIYRMTHLFFWQDSVSTELACTVLIISIRCLILCVFFFWILFVEDLFISLFKNHKQIYRDEFWYFPFLFVVTFYCSCWNRVVNLVYFMNSALWCCLNNLKDASSITYYYYNTYIFSL